MYIYMYRCGHEELAEEIASYVDNPVMLHVDAYLDNEPSWCAYTEHIL